MKSVVKPTNKFSRAVALISASILLAVLIIAVCFGLLGCASDPAWKVEAKQAYQHASFAPDVEEVIPGSLINQKTSASGVSSVSLPSMAIFSNPLLISETGAAPDLGYLTLSGEINICKSRISYAIALKDQVLAGVGMLNETGQWKNGCRLDISEDGTIEFRQQNTVTNKVIFLVRLSADRTTVEIVNFPYTIDDGNNIYQYSRYSSYDGEVFIDMDFYEFFKSKGSADFSHRSINYREYRKAENGIIRSSLVQIVSAIEYGDEGLPTGNTNIDSVDVTAYGGNDSTFYRHWRRIYSDNSIVADFHIENKEGNVFLQLYDDVFREPWYNIFASAHLLNIAKLYLAEESNNEEFYKIYKCTGLELSDGTVLYPEKTSEISWDKMFWEGSISHYTAQNIYTALIGFINIPMEINMDDAVESFGFEFIDAGLDFSSLYNGAALKLIEDIRISGIEGIKSTEITFENVFTLYTKMYEFFDEKMV